MIIGVPKEIKTEEFRWGSRLQGFGACPRRPSDPAGSRRRRGSGFSDNEYRKAGADQ